MAAEVIPYSIIYLKHLDNLYPISNLARLCLEIMLRCLPGLNRFGSDLK